jgi:hypothetical protein
MKSLDVKEQFVELELGVKSYDVIAEALGSVKTNVD